MKNKYSTENFLKLTEKSKNILDRIYEREDFNNDIKEHRKKLKISQGGFDKLDTLDIEDKKFKEKAKKRRKKYGSSTITNTLSEMIWLENLTDKQQNILNTVGQKLKEKYQLKVNFELPDFIEDYILRYLLYNIRSYKIFRCQLITQPLISNSITHKINIIHIYI